MDFIIVDGVFEYEARQREAGDAGQHDDRVAHSAPSPNAPGGQFGTSLARAQAPGASSIGPAGRICAEATLLVALGAPGAIAADKAPAAIGAIHLAARIHGQIDERVAEYPTSPVAAIP